MAGLWAGITNKVRRMQIVYLYRTRATGVEAVHIMGIVDSLRERGHEVELVGPPMTSEVGSGAKPSLLGRMASRVAGAMPELVFELLEFVYSFPTILKMLWLRRRLRYSAVYERYAIFGIAGAAIAALTRVPLVLEVNYTSLSPLVRKRSRLLRPFARLLDRWIFRRATAIAAVSSYLRDELVREFGVAPERVLVVPNAADPRIFVPLPRLDDSGDFTIGFVGSFFPWHGIDTLVRAVGKLREAGEPFRVDLVGDGPQRASIEALVDQLGLRDTVVFHGRVDHSRLPEVIRNFDVGVMPDSNEYGSPMKIFEYMAMAKPVVVPDYGPLRDAVEDGVQGFIFERGSADALAACLRRASSDRARLKTMGNAARASIERDRNWMNNTVISMRAAGIEV